jgi:hypothetical protein
MAFDYSSRDYSTIKADLLARASRIAPEWTDRNASDFGMVLVDLWAYMGDVLHYYVDRAAGESVLPTATQRESVLAFANLLDYEPSGRTGAEATVLLTNSSSIDIVVPQYTKFIARYDNKTYQAYSPSSATVPANSTQNITVKEGTLVYSPAETLTNSASGLSSQRYTLTNQEVVRNSVVITVYEDGITPTTYRKVTRLSNAVSGDRVYSLQTTANGDIDVVFGTEVRGFIPPPGSTITAIYSYSSGSGGNLPANSVTAFRDANPAGISITSSSAFSGGVDAESIPSMKSSIPALTTAQNRAVTKADFVNLALSVDGVSKAAVSYTPNPAGGASAGNASVTVYGQTNRTNDYLTTSDVSQTVSAETQAAIVSAIQPKAMLGIDVVAAPTITWTQININVNVYVNENAVALYVKNDVEEAINNILSFDSVSFGQTLSLGQVYRSILSQFGVDYAEITLFDESGGSAVETSITVGATSLPKKGAVAVTAIGGVTST